MFLLLLYCYNDNNNIPIVQRRRRVGIHFRLGPDNNIMSPAADTNRIIDTHNNII